MLSDLFSLLAIYSMIFGGAVSAGDASLFFCAPAMAFSLMVGVTGLFILLFRLAISAGRARMLPVLMGGIIPGRM